MKTKMTNSSLILILAASGIIFFAGCATMETDNTKPLLSTAGFRVRTPQTADQKALYASLPNNKMERRTGTSTISAALHAAACRAGTGRANELQSSV